MTLIQCPECKKQVSHSAEKCPNCGYRLTPEIIQKAQKSQKEAKKYAGIGCLALIAIVILVMQPWKKDEKTTSVKPTTRSHQVKNLQPKMDISSKPMLELIDWNWCETYGYVTAEGRVKNISGKNLENLRAVVTWYANDGEFITSDSGLIEYDPILADQTSPFKVIARHNPAMKKASIEFKEMFGGKIPHKSKQR